MDARTFWNDKFGPERYAYGEAPNAFLAEHADLFPAGSAVLSLGEGEGRNAVFLAGRGVKVHAVDASPRGLEKMARLAASRGVTVAGEERDLAGFAPGEDRWDGVYNIFCHLPPEVRTALYPRIRLALRPGGVFLTEQFSPAQLAYKSGGPKDERLLTTLAELEAAFEGFEVLEGAETLTTLDEGPLHQGPAAVVRFVARKRGANKR